MINNDEEYQQTIFNINEQKQRLIQYSQNWEKEGYSKEQVKKLLEPLESFHIGLVEEAENYMNGKNK
jgi:peptide methionine sulfoxide reductase MsrA